MTLAELLPWLHDMADRAARDAQGVQDREQRMKLLGREMGFEAAAQFITTNSYLAEEMILHCIGSPHLHRATIYLGGEVFSRGFQDAAEEIRAVIIAES